MYDIEEINDFAALSRHRDEWQALVLQTEGATFFHTFDWFEVFWKHYGAGRKLRAIRVSRAGKLIGILPLVVQVEPRKVGTVRILTYPLADWGSFYSPLGPEPAETLKAALAHICQTPRDWDLVELRWLKRGSPLAEHSERALRRGGFQAYERVRERTSLIHLPGDWETYFTSLPKKFRESHRRHQRKLYAQGEIEHVDYRPRGAAHGEEDPRWELYDTCEQIASKSWQGSSETGTTLSHHAVRPFLRDVHAAAARAGALDLHILYLGGRPLAFAYNYHWQRSAFGLRVGYDAEVSKNGVGNEMTLHVVRHAIEQGDRLYDMGPGSLDYKRTFATEVVDIVQYTHYYPLAARAQALRLNHCLGRFWERPAAATTEP
jgi:CelD/BcsL family acetyltransferase involved in cellulose biosynthesis